MPNILIFTPTNGTVLDYKLSVDEQAYLGRSDVLFNPTIPTNPNRSEWKVDGGVLREWTQAEKDARDAALAAAKAAFDAKVLSYTSALATKFDALTAGIATMQGKITTWNGITSPTAAQLKTAIIDTASNLVGLAQVVNDLKPLLTEFYKDWAGRQ
jgi:hypothetical protein